MTGQQPNPHTPSWAQPAPPPPTVGWGPPPQPPEKKRTGLKVALGVVGAIIVISIIGAAANGSSKKTDDDNAAAAPSASATTEQSSAAPAPTRATHKPKPAAKTVLTESGNGIKTTAKFHVSGDWDLHYTYDCAAFGMQGNFVVTTGGTSFPLPLANELGKKGAEVTHQHDGGTLYLEIDSECSWTVKVVDIP